MDPETERAIRRLERYFVRTPGCLFKGALLWALGAAAAIIALWFIGYFERLLR